MRQEIVRDRRRNYLKAGDHEIEVVERATFRWTAVGAPLRFDGKPAG